MVSVPTGQKLLLPRLLPSNPCGLCLPHTPSLHSGEIWPAEMRWQAAAEAVAGQHQAGQVGHGAALKPCGWEGGACELVAFQVDVHSLHRTGGGTAMAGCAVGWQRAPAAQQLHSSIQSTTQALLSLSRSSQCPGIPALCLPAGPARPTPLGVSLSTGWQSAAMAVE